MEEPKNVAARGICPGIHLCRSIRLALHNLIAEVRANGDCIIRASAISDNDLCFRRALAQVLQKSAYQARLVKDGSNDRYLHLDQCKRFWIKGTPFIFVISVTRTAGFPALLRF